MLIEKLFYHAREEIEAGMLLPGKSYEELFKSQDAIPELEKLLHNDVIPQRGLSSSNTNFDCGSQVKELIACGLFDPNFQITSREQWENEGKILADTTTAICTGMMMDG